MELIFCYNDSKIQNSSSKTSAENISGTANQVSSRLCKRHVYVKEETMNRAREKVDYCKMPSRSASRLREDKRAVAGETKTSKNHEPHHEVRMRDVLCSRTCYYRIQDFIGEGCFGKVAKCVNLVTSQDVAIKILKSENSEDVEEEIKMLKAVSALDPVKKNVAQFLETFKHKGQTCLAFEMLDRNLHQLFRERRYKPLSLSEIRPMAQQLLTAFDALKGIGVVHSDLKPDNVMLTNHQGEPFRVKLIDFGVSFPTSKEHRGHTIQPLGYRAPEVFLGLPVSESIDMWSLGCVLFWLYVAEHLFPGHYQYQSMRGIVDILGQPADHLLRAGYFTHKFFTMNQKTNYPKWWLKTPGEYKLYNDRDAGEWDRSFKSLDDLITVDIEQPIELEDQRAFVSLLKSLLQTDSKKRMIPEKAITHPFVTMAHLMDEMDMSEYVNESFHKMLVCPMDYAEEADDDEADEESKGEGPSARTRTNGTGLASSHRADSTSDGFPVKLKKSPLKRIQKFFCRAASTSDGFPVKVKKSLLKRAQKFFNRAARTLLGKKEMLNVICLAE
ncbi:homeodomain-interacting protein kinase 2 isoform X1 [Perca flavescens]|nr:homeodomain-interacting protein kinase 2-like isoform X1 [Perca flavescens]